MTIPIFFTLLTQVITKQNLPVEVPTTKSYQKGVCGSNVCLFDIVRHEKVWSLRVRGPQEVLYSGQMIDSPLVTSLYDKKSRWGKRRHQSIQPLRCGAQRRGDALPNSKQQGPRSDTSVRLSLLKPAPLNFCLSELVSFKDVQPRCFILRSVLPTRTRFLIDLTYFFLLSALTKT